MTHSRLFFAFLCLWVSGVSSGFSAENAEPKKSGSSFSDWTSSWFSGDKSKDSTPPAPPAVTQENKEKKETPAEEKKESATTSEKNKKPSAAEIDAVVKESIEAEKNAPAAHEPPPPLRDYRTAVPSPLIYKKNYSRDNQHLPSALYTSDYQEMLYQAMARGDREVVRSLVQKLEDVNFVDRDGNTLLMRATMLGNATLMQVLLGMNADPNRRNNQGNSPLLTATGSAQREPVLVLLTYGADINQTNSAGDTALMVAARLPTASTVFSLLLARNADMELVNKKGQTALWIAASSRNDDAVEMLLKKSARVDAATSDGTTPLMAAAATGDARVVSSLLQAGANVEMRDISARTAYDIAQQSGSMEVAELIQSEVTRRSLMAARMNDEENRAHQKEQALAVYYVARRDPKTHAPLPVLRPGKTLPALPSPSFGGMNAAALPYVPSAPRYPSLSTPETFPPAEAVISPTPQPTPPSRANDTRLMGLFR